MNSRVISHRHSLCDYVQGKPVIYLITRLRYKAGILTFSPNVILTCGSFSLFPLLAFLWILFKSPFSWILERYDGVNRPRLGNRQESSARLREI